MPEVLHRSTLAAVNSDAATLKRVLVHRPGLELSRLTPDNAEDLLFDEIPLAPLAALQHDGFVTELQAADVHVVYAVDALTAALMHEGARRSVIDAVVYESPYPAKLREYLRALSAAELSQQLIGGVTEAELSGESNTDLLPFALTPLPNFMFMRDSSAVIGTTIHVARMRKPARQREAVLARLIHQEFTANVPTSASATAVEGGDILIASERTLVLGASERSSFQAATELTTQFLQRVPDGTAIIVPLPEARWVMHLDTVLTMVAQNRFLAYGVLYDTLLGYRFQLTRRGVECLGAEDLSTALTKANGRQQPDVLRFTGDSTGLQSEQWNDAYNVLALAPNIVIAYAHNDRCNTQLATFGLEVRTISGLELGKGRGGPRCMSCPLVRAA